MWLFFWPRAPGAALWSGDSNPPVGQGEDGMHGLQRDSPLCQAGCPALPASLPDGC